METAHTPIVDGTENHETETPKKSNKATWIFGILGAIALIVLGTWAFWPASKSKDKAAKAATTVTQQDSIRRAMAHQIAVLDSTVKEQDALLANAGNSQIVRDSLQAAKDSITALSSQLATALAAATAAQTTAAKPAAQTAAQLDAAGRPAKGSVVIDTINGKIDYRKSDAKLLVGLPAKYAGYTKTEWRR